MSYMELNLRRRWCERMVTPIEVSIEIHELRFLLDALETVKEAKKEYPDLKVQIKVLGN